MRKYILLIFYIVFLILSFLLSYPWYIICDYLAKFFIALFIIVLCLNSIKKSYTPLSEDSKSSAWQIVSNIFLVFFTFWMGIFVQDIIASKNEEVNTKMIRFEYVDRLIPNYKKLLHNDLLADMGVYADINQVISDREKAEEDSQVKEYLQAKKNNINTKTNEYLLNHKTEIIALSKEHDSIMADYKHYLNKQMFDSISKINRERNIYIAIAELACDSSLLDSTNYCVINDIYDTKDSIQAKLLAYFEGKLKSPQMEYSANPTADYYKCAQEACDIYNRIKMASDAELEQTFSNEALKRLMRCLIVDCQIMLDEINLKRNNSSERTLSMVRIFLDNPVSAFLIFLLLSFSLSAIIIHVISPHRIKAAVAKELYDKQKKEVEYLKIKLRQKEIELDNKRKQCRESDATVKELKKAIQDRDNKISNLEDIANE